MYTHTHTCTHVYTYVYTHAHTHTHTHTYIHTHTSTGLHQCFIQKITLGGHKEGKLISIGREVSIGPIEVSIF